jgi:hypothetical protein
MKVILNVLAIALLPGYSIAQDAPPYRAIASFTSKPVLKWTQLTSPVIADLPPAPLDSGTPGGTKGSGGTHADRPPAPPDSGTPVGQRTPGGSRGGACKQTDKPLTALVPENARVLTTAEHPVFWFYIPDAPEDIQSIEFSVHNREDTETLYRTSVQLSKTPGVVGIPLPSSPAYSLKLNESYRWRLIVDCDPNKTSENVLELYGSVTRVQQDSNAWYDNLTNLAQRYLFEPQNPEVKKAWTELLKSVGLEELAPAPLVKSSQ